MAARWYKGISTYAFGIDSPDPLDSRRSPDIAPGPRRTATSLLADYMHRRVATRAMGVRRA